MARGTRTCGRAVLALCFAAGWGGSAAADGAQMTEVVELLRPSKVYAQPSTSERHFRGRVLRSTRVRVLERRAATRDCRSGWVRIDDGAWLCASGVVETDAPPAADAVPQVKPGSLLPHRYVVTLDGQAYASIDDAVARREPRPLPGRGGFRIRAAKYRDGIRLFRTSEGWVRDDEARVARPLRFRGAHPGETAVRGFVRSRAAPVFDKSGRRSEASLAPRSVLEQVGVETTVGARQLVPIGGERYLLPGDVARVELTARPAGVADGERWIDVDLSEQVLVAYEGDTPVLATLVSTGKRDTPVGTFTIQKKRAVSFMKSRPESTGDKWNVDTPWVMTLAGRIAMHPVYWHSDLGKPVSHGCVNLSPLDARFLYDWTEPKVPAGWRTLLSADGEGTVVRIRR